MTLLNRSQTIKRARAGLFALLAVSSGACVNKAPTYDGQKRLPPYVVMASVIPNPGVVAEIRDGSMAFEVPFRSEDLGESVSAVFFVDSQFVNDLEYGPSIFADDTRKVENLIELDEGCHLVQLMLTHSDNLRRPGSPPIDGSLAALVYWWAIVPPEEGEVHCPR
jgi:hypothetical protein